MREDIKLKTKAYIYNYRCFDNLHHCARQEIYAKFKHLNPKIHYSYNRYFKKHLGFEYNYSFQQNFLDDVLILIRDERKYLMFKLKYGL